MILVLPNVMIELSNMRKKIRVLPNVTKVRLEVMLVLHNVWTKPLNVRKKKVREPPNVKKEPSHVMLKPYNVRMKPSNMRKKKKGTTKCHKSTVKYDIETV